MLDFYLSNLEREVPAPAVLLVFVVSFSPPNKNFELGSSVFQEFFSNFTEGFIFFKMSKKRSNYESSVFLRIYRGAKKVFFSFLAIFDKNTGHRVTKFHPVYRINVTYKCYFMIFSLTQNFF